ncbi:hypothetical protein I7I50_07165 [Histoplasma capsulatum G186AR]|uniref:Uncharacterized protein n=1 Tax=Ajellomyces capsulatus TaxID=5037 RepID=A0A8H8D2Q5_AJECA|nr:hypothetical protein I7I52_09767 [Histoplasma capsulatum]QSS67933.1 hypothetical protein I7I50_07165 [Histoplasma capsulatum G186AR]
MGVLAQNQQKITFSCYASLYSEIGFGGVVGMQDEPTYGNAIDVQQYHHNIARSQGCFIQYTIMFHA